MSQSFLSNISRDDTKNSINIYEKIGDFSTVKESGSVKNEYLDVTSFKDITIKEESLEAVDDPVTVFKMSNLDSLKQEPLTLQVCNIVGTLLTRAVVFYYLMNVI